ncbi:MAG: SbmA/BacA-like family transporter [Luteolibacter sp.]
MKAKLLRDTCRRLKAVLTLLVKSESGPKAVGLFSTLLILMLVLAGLNVLNSYIGRDFMSAIEHKNMRNFNLYALLFFAVLSALTICAVFFRFAEERLGLLWREQLTKHLLGAYLNDRTYYRLLLSPDVANPDQRIADDVGAFTRTTLSFVLMFLNGTFTAISFSSVLWSISPFLFCVAVVYSTLGSMLTIMLGKPLIRLNYTQLDKEANFRSDLIHVRENAELIALSHREGRFKVRLGNRLDSLIRNYRRIVQINRNLGFFTTGYNYYIQIIPALIIAPMFIRGHVEFGVITQSAMAFGALLGSFSLIVTQFQSISAFTAVTTRLYLLTQAMEKARGAKTCPIHTEENADRVVYSNVTIESADQTRPLVQNLNIEIKPGQRWVVTSDDQSTMIGLFRATAGLGDCGSGSISRPNLEEILFLPERPYLPLGTLREVLLRTGKENEIPDHAIFTVLQRLRLEDLTTRAGGLDVSQEWDDLLSIGEQHMVSVARLLLAKPKIVFLDRPGSSLPENTIASIIDLLSQEKISVVVLAKNGESHLRYDARLDIKADGSWTVGHTDTMDTFGEHLDLSC